ncbi:MAG: hypothetical protein K0U38_10565 [Epsilonproteobacteria bacterium]|nr:hypothetical protein [Campylobacterota bacterium]
MLELISQITLFIVLAVLFGTVIGYLLAKPPHLNNHEEESNTDLHIDATTGIVSDASSIKKSR